MSGGVPCSDDLDLVALRRSDGPYHLVRVLIHLQAVRTKPLNLRNTVNLPG
jgi:hypothetical protein